MQLTFTVRTRLDPWEDLADRMYSNARGDLVMILRALQRGGYAGDREALDIAYATIGLPPFIVHPFLIWLRDRVIHPQT